MHYNSTITLLKNSLFKTTLFYSLIFQRKSWINANWCNHIFSCQRLITVTNWAKFWNAFRMTTSSIGETSSRTLIILLSTLLMLESLKLSHFVEFGGQTDWRQKYQVCVQKYLGGVHKLRLQTLAFFDHLTPSVYIFYGMKVYKKSIFLTTYPPPLVNVVCERPLN